MSNLMLNDSMIVFTVFDIIIWRKISLIGRI